jgi:hypothetical protein
MLNRTVEVKVYPNEGTNWYYYSWRKNESDNWNVHTNSKKFAFRALLKDIFRDKIPISNINIHRDIMEKFKQYQNSHRGQIEVLNSSVPYIWAGEEDIPSTSLLPTYDSDIE